MVGQLSSSVPAGIVVEEGSSQPEALVDTEAFDAPSPETSPTPSRSGNSPRRPSMKGYAMEAVPTTPTKATSEVVLEGGRGKRERKQRVVENIGHVSSVG
jgi:hypothetical protein